MEPTQLLCLLSPMVSFSAVIGAVFYYLPRRHKETEYELEIKKLRQSLLKGQLNAKAFRYIRDNMKVEEHFNIESQRLSNLFNQNLMDSDTYSRMKKALELTFNERLVKIHASHNA
ncbi:MAG: hypothetical protein NWF06_04610 [Candidatus Bathyarchaeota archaeon]|nr:hypothetical protein [Candidatus Bathyarchaeum sp.]